MNLSLLLVVLVVFAFAAGRWLTGHVSRFVALSGVEYILVGLLVGPRTPWGILSEDSVSRLQPLIYLLLGLAGFTLGLRARRAARSTELGLAATVTSVVVFSLSTACFLWILSRWMQPSENVAFYLQQVVAQWDGMVLELWISSEQLWVAVGLAASASVASSSVITHLLDSKKAQGPVSQFVASCGDVSELIGVIALGLLMAAGRATGTGRGSSLTIVEWSLSTVAVGVVCGVLFSLFIGHEKDPQRIFLATVGLVTFASGVGSALGVSPLFTNLLAGLTVSLISPHARGLATELARLNHPLFVLLMIFAGTLWSPPKETWMWVMPVAYCLVRTVAFRLGARLADRTAVATPTAARRLGSALWGQGTMAVAIAVNLALRDSEHAGLVLSTVLVGALISDLFSLRALRSVLADAGELVADADVAGQPPTSAPSEVAS